MDEIDRALAELAVKNGSSEAEMAADRAQQSIRADPKWIEIKEVRLCRVISVLLFATLRVKS